MKEINHLKGLFGLICSLVWFIFTSDSPDKNRFIKTTEKEYIMKATAEIKLSAEEKRVIPWVQILKSRPVICLILVTLSANFGISLFTTCLPSYMAEVFNFDYKSVINEEFFFIYSHKF